MELLILKVGPGLMPAGLLLDQPVQMVFQPVTLETFHRNCREASLCYGAAQALRRVQYEMLGPESEFLEGLAFERPVQEITRMRHLDDELSSRLHARADIAEHLDRFAEMLKNMEQRHHVEGAFRISRNRRFDAETVKIGRASCRERVFRSV